MGVLRAWLRGFVALQGFDRAMALAALAFSALLPLLMVIAAVLPRTEKAEAAGNLVRALDVPGAASATVREAFATPATIESSVTALSAVLVLVSALSFTRGLQRLYEFAYRQPALGMRGTKYGLMWLGLVIVLLVAGPPVFHGLAGAGDVIAMLALFAWLWAVTPRLLLARRMTWKRLMPGAALASVGMTVLVASSVVWLPRMVASSASQFGAIGVAFAMLTWFVGAGVVLVAAAAGGAALDDWLQAREAR